MLRSLCGRSRHTCHCELLSFSLQWLSHAQSFFLSRRGLVFVERELGLLINRPLCRRFLLLLLLSGGDEDC